MSTLALLLSAGGYEWVPFKLPAPIWDYWYLLLLPLCLAVAIVYKSIRCFSMKQVPREALILFIFILVVMVLTAGALAGLVEVLEH